VTFKLQRHGRARALQALYAWDVRDGQPLDRVAALVWDDLAVSADEREFAAALTRIVSAQGAELDAELAEVTTNWRLDRLGAIERCVLRLAAAELQQGSTPAKVVIQEAVRMAEAFGSAPSARFVNGVLDALARRMGRL
jgi:N utilization substance protein B